MVVFFLNRILVLLGAMVAVTTTPPVHEKMHQWAYNEE
jgi:hypothetical protein